MDCKEQVLRTIPTPEGEILPDYFYNTACAPPEELPIEGFGAIFERWRCGTSNWDFVGAGMDIEPPDEEMKVIKRKPTKASIQRGGLNGLVYPEHRVSSYVELSEFEIELEMFRSQFFELRAIKLRRQMELWRVVARDEEQTFCAFNGHIIHLPVKFPGGDGEEMATVTLKIQPSGPPHWDRLFPSN